MHNAFVEGTFQTWDGGVKKIQSTTGLAATVIADPPDAAILFCISGKTVAAYPSVICDFGVFQFLFSISVVAVAPRPARRLVKRKSLPRLRRLLRTQTSKWPSVQSAAKWSPRRDWKGTPGCAQKMPLVEHSSQGLVTNPLFYMGFILVRDFFNCRRLTEFGQG